MSDEDTKNPLDNDEVMGFLRGEAEETKAPGDKAGTIVSRGDSLTSPFPAVVREVSGNRYYTVYNRRTGDPSTCHFNSMPNVLRKRYTDGPFEGELVFTQTDPGIRPEKGTHKCHLHKDDPRREEFDNYGFPVCIAGSLASEYERDRHASRKHKTEWATIQAMEKKAKEDTRDERDEEDRQERKDIMRMLVERVTNGDSEDK